MGDVSIKQGIFMYFLMIVGAYFHCGGPNSFSMKHGMELPLKILGAKIATAFSDRCWDLLVGHEHKIASGPVPGFSGSFREARHAQDERRPVPAGKLKNASEMEMGQ